jgi:ribulose-phosphate 3-epimerase
MRILIAPSILSADFARLGEQVRECEAAGADRLHIDVMDGHFVPNLSMGPAVVASLRRITSLPLEVHLMVEHPESFIKTFVDAGSTTLIGHIEVSEDPRIWLDLIRKHDCRAGLAIKPETPLDPMRGYLKDIDLALCMTVHPGYSGQAFLREMLPKIRQMRDWIDHDRLACELEVDGGINLETGAEAVSAGANVLVAATAVFQWPEGPGAAVRQFRRRFPEVEPGG